MKEPANGGNFDGMMYLAANYDLAMACKHLASTADQLEFAEKHFFDHGQFEGRLQFRRSSLVEFMERKPEKLKELLRRSPGTSYRAETADVDYFGITVRTLRSKGFMEFDAQSPVSSNAYDPEVQALFDQGDGLFLDLGAGYRLDAHPRVIFVEVAPFPSTDVLSDASTLPFDDNTFDGSVCLAVLEHLKDPWAAAAELVRVTRPGGTILVDWPFLQPFHGYPNHYFNATESGARDTFMRTEADLSITSEVPGHLHPMFSIGWILNKWASGLSDNDRRNFDGLSVGSIRGLDAAWAVANEAWCKLDSKTELEISSGTRLRIIKNS